MANWKKEDEKLEKTLGLIDDGMDVLLQGIDDIHGNLVEQKDIIEKVDGMVDEHASDLAKVAGKLKKNLNNWRKFSNPCLDIVMIASVVVLLGA